MSVRDLIILGCSSQQPTRFRNHSGYLLRWNGEGFLFDPGEGTQRQFIYADVSPSAVTRILISHFHGDHCLGLGSMFMRLNLDRVAHPIHCYYPASGKVYFDRLRFGTVYRDHIRVIEHPVSEGGIVHEDENFTVEAAFLDHGIDNIGWRITETDSIKFDAAQLEKRGIRGRDVRRIEEEGKLVIDGETVWLSDVSSVRKGDLFAYVIDTKPCRNAVRLARGAQLFLCESTYLEAHAELARNYAHLTARQAAMIAREAKVGRLILTHFSARYRSVTPFVEEAAGVFANVDAAEDCKHFPFPKR